MSRNGLRKKRGQKEKKIEKEKETKQRGGRTATEGRVKGKEIGLQKKEKKPGAKLKP